MSVLLDTHGQLAGPKDPRPAEPSSLAPIRAEDLAEVGVSSEATSIVRFARDLAEHHPHSPTARVRLAQALAAAGQMSAAASVASDALERAQQEGDRSAVSAAYAIISAFEPGGEQFRRLKMDGLSAIAIASLAARDGDFDEAWRAIAPEESSSGDALRGWIALKRSNFQAAVGYLRRSLRAGNASPSVLTNLGYAHAALGSHSKALKATHEALVLAPGRRRTAFNLINFNSLFGQEDSASDVLDGLSEKYPNDLDVVFARARRELGMHQADRAVRTLRRAQMTLSEYTTGGQRFELRANIAYTAWLAGNVSLATAQTEVSAQIAEGHQSALRVGSMLPPLFRRVSDLPHLVETRALFAENAAMPRLDVHMAALSGEFDAAARSAENWAREAIFDPDAATAATYLISCSLGDHERAAKIGLRALEIMPSVHLVRNNTVYSLAMSGEISTAREVAEGLPMQTPHELATHALVMLATSRIDAALSKYQEAYKLARRVGDEHLARLVLANQAIGFKHFAPHIPIDRVPLPDDDDLATLLTRRLAQIEGVVVS